jgi:hypothetical protein
MRIVAVVAVTAVSLALAGCHVQSIYPLYTEDKLTFDPGLVGTWADPGEPDESIVFEASGENAYKVTFVADGVSSEYEGRLVQLGESVYLDVFPEQERLQGRREDFVPVHIIHRIQRDGDELKAALIEEEWLSKKIDSGEINIPHFRYDGTIVLTVETEELQHAVMGFGGTKEAFAEHPLFHRVK